MPLMKSRLKLNNGTQLNETVFNLTEIIQLHHSFQKGLELKRVPFSSKTDYFHQISHFLLISRTHLAVSFLQQKNAVVTYNFFIHIQ